MKILNYGSLNIDFVYGVNNFVKSQETISSISLQKFAGGKGLNQSIALAKSGASVFHAGKVGEDGKFLIEELKKANVNTDFVLDNAGTTGHAIIQVDQHGQNCIIIHGGANNEITEKEIDFTLSHFEKGDMLLLQNEINNIGYIMEKAYEKGMIIALNPSPINDQLLNMPMEKVTYFLLNETEGNQLTGESEPQSILLKMLDIYPGSITVLTLGKQGVICYDGRKFYKNGIYNTPVVDTTAAGDTFTGFFLGKISEGASIQTALQIASKAASIAVSVSGAAPSIPSLETVLSLDLEEISCF